MSSRDKIAAAVEMLVSQKVGESTAAPPLWRLCWSVGLHLPPPHFLAFLSIALLFGVPYGLAIGTCLAVALTAFGNLVEWVVFGMALVSAVLFGVSLAAHYRYSAWAMSLPSWTEFDPYFDAVDDTW